MTRRDGRAPRGQRGRIVVPQGHDKTTTVTAALRADGLCAVDLTDGATNGDRVRAYVNLAPVLRHGGAVILDNLLPDNLGIHKVAVVREGDQGGWRASPLPPALLTRLQLDRTDSR